MLDYRSVNPANNLMKHSSSITSSQISEAAPGPGRRLSASGMQVWRTFEPFSGLSIYMCALIYYQTTSFQFSVRLVPPPF